MHVVATYLALVLLATPLRATVPIFLLYIALAIGVISVVGTRESNNTTHSMRAWICALPIGFFFATRAIPFIQWGLSALGADTGAYYRSFNACFARLAACAKEPIAILGYPLYSAGIGTQTILILLHITASVGLLWGVYRLTKKEWGVMPAFWSAVIYVLSLPQFLFYWSFFLKMEIATALSLFALHAYTERRARAASYIALTGIIHPLPLVPLVGAILLTGILKKEVAYSLSITAIGTAIAAIYRWNDILGYVAYVASYATGTYEPTAETLLAGHFIGFSFYHNALMLFYIPFALIVLAWHIQKNSIPAIGWYALISLGLISVNAAFHNRFIILFDIAAIILAGNGLASFASQQKTAAGKYALGIIITLLALYSLQESIRIEPLVNAQEFKEIIALQDKYTGLPIFINNPVYQQFVAGYAKHPAITSQFNEEPWAHLNTPSLIYNARRSTPIQPRNNQRFTRISENFFIYSPY